MKKYYFYIYLVLLGSGLVYFGLHQYHKYEANKAYAEQQSQTEGVTTATDALIAKYEAQLKTSPGDERISLELANAYIQKARETGDTDYYSKVDSLMDVLQAKNPNNPEVYATRGAIALSRHHFVDALDLGNKAIELNQNKALYYGIVVDAQTELGMNDEAVNTLQAMVDKRPDYSSFSRIAYARELHGDIEGARAAITTAVEEGAAFPENVAWGYVELGKLDARTDLVKAEQQFNLALSIVPKYTPAMEQLGKIAFAKNDIDGARAHFQSAFDILPLAQYAIDLGEVYTKTGDTAKAKQQYELARLAFDKAKTSGVNTDLEYSVFLSEHDLGVAEALLLALASYKVRPSIYGADAVAWAYYKNNQPAEAQQYIAQALRLGQNDAGIVFHAGMIAEQNGKATEAKAYFQKALSLNPHFSILYAGIAESKLK